MFIFLGLHSKELDHMKKIDFSIGETHFAAIQIKKRTTYWVLHLAETGVVHEPGMGGISNDSVPKMKASIQRLLDDVSKGDVKDFRARFGMPAEPCDKLPCVMIVPYGYSTLAIEGGYEHAGDIESTDKEILANHFGEDNIFVKLDHVPGKPKVYKYAKYAK